MPNFDGKYFYGDYCAGSVLSFEQSGGAAVNHQTWTAQLGAGLPFTLTSFGRDEEGEIYITDRDGLVHKIVPPLGQMEVSGDGAATYLTLSKTGDWSWENLQVSSGHLITSYRVLRAVIADGLFDLGLETFNCVHAGAGTTWPAGGDLVDPANPGEWFAYVVTALDAGGNQSSPGGSPPYTIGGAVCP
jgi:hypothetical protein